MFPTQECIAPQRVLSLVTILALTSVLLAPFASGFNNAEDSGEPLPSISKLVPRIGRSGVFFKAAKSLPRIGKRVNNNEIFPEMRRYMKPLPRVGRSSHDGDDNFMLKGALTSDVFKVVEPDFEPHQVVRRAGTADQQTHAGTWGNGDLPWFRQQDGPNYLSKRNGLADLEKLPALPWEDAVMKEKPQEAPLAIVTLADDKNEPDVWSYIFNSDHRQE